MKFWDSSAVIPLLVGEPATRAAQALARENPAILVWWGTPVECASAIARLERDAALDEAGASKALARLAALSAAWHEIEATDLVRETAMRCLRVHALRAADALQLAAALVAAQGRPSTVALVTRGDRLAGAARREGFQVVPLE